MTCMDHSPPDKPSPDVTPSAPHPDEIAVVIVNWNGWRMSLACLDALRTSVGARWHLYLVDNASVDDSRAHLVELGTDVTVVLADANGGWTGGNNLGVRRALGDGFDHIFILNNDAFVEPGTLAELLRFYKERGTQPVLGPLHLDHDGEAADFVGAKVNARSGLPEISRIQEVVVAALPPVYPTAFVKGAAIFATRRHFDRLGLFDDAYYLNYDDTDWGMRANKAGFELLMLASARIRHAGSGSIGGALSPLNLYFLARNELLFAERHCRPWQRPAQLVDFLRRANRIPPYPSRFRRQVHLWFGKSATVRAWRAGVRDYVLRRFGDCPPEIRRLSNAR